MRGETESQDARRVGRAVPYVVLGVSLAVTFGVWQAALHSLNMREEARFRSAALRTKSSIEKRVQRQAELLQTAAAMISAQGAPTKREFETFYDSIEKDQYQGTVGLGYVTRVLPSQASAIVQRRRAEGDPDFHIFPPVPGDFTVLYLEPKTPINAKAIGFNTHSEALRAKAMDAARDDNRPAMTSTIQLLQDDGKTTHPAALLYMPVYRGGDPGSTELRRSQLLGYIYSPFRVREMLDSALKEDGPLEVAVRIYEGDHPDPKRQIFSNVPARAGHHRTIDSSDLAGARWLIEYVALPPFEEISDQSLVNSIPAVGILISLLLSGLSLIQSGANRTLSDTAEELGRRAYQQRLLAQAGVLLGESLDVDRTLRNVAQLAVPSFADWCAVDLLDETGSIRRVATAHIDPKKVRWAVEMGEKYPPDPDAPDGVAKVLRTGQPELAREITSEMIEGIQDPERRKLVQELGITSAIICPITVRDVTLGAITFVWAESKRHYDAEDLSLAQEIGKRAGIAVENARLFSENQRELEDRRRAEREVRELNENLDRLVRERTMELEAANHELEAFCYSVSHDLRAPLRGVDGFSKAVIEDYGDRLDSEGLHYLHRVRASAKRMDELITALLSLSRLTRAELHRERVDITQVALDTAEEVRHSQGVENVKVEVQPDMFEDADPRFVRIVFDNLIGNAVKFSSRQEQPCIEVGRQGETFFVRDNGVGFNPDYSNKLFGPFERLHSANEFPGSGIGLATVQRIVARHGGRIWAESEEGKGATFWFTLHASGN